MEAALGLVVGHNQHTVGGASFFCDSCEMPGTHEVQSCQTMPPSLKWNAKTCLADRCWWDGPAEETCSVPLCCPGRRHHRVKRKRRSPVATSTGFLSPPLIRASTVLDGGTTLLVNQKPRNPKRVQRQQPHANRRFT